MANPSLSQIPSGWRLIENRALLLLDGAIEQLPRTAPVSYLHEVAEVVQIKHTIR
jgi:hypothetical protein